MEALFRLGDLDHGPGRALLKATVSQGFSEAVAVAGLRAELEAWRAPGALDQVRAELPPELAPERRPRAVLIIAARTLPVSTMRAVLMARLLDARVLLKPASGQTNLAQAIADADPAVEVRPFSAQDTDALRRAIEEVDTVVVLGSDATVAAVGAHVPAPKTFVGYGHRVSAGWIHTLTEATAAGLARDLCAWDQAGCLSPQVVWVRGDLDQARRAIAAAVRRVEVDLPMSLPPEAARARHVSITLAEMIGTREATATAEILTAPDGPFRSSPGWRTLWLLPADRDAMARVAPQLSTLAYAGEERDRPNLPGVRICAPGEMQRPPLTWPHDGRPNLTPLLRRGR